MNLHISPSSGITRAALLATSIGLIVASHAADRIKQNNALNLSDPASWDTLPGALDVGLWDATVAGANTVSLGADLSLAGIRVASPGGLVTINAGSTLTLGTAGIDLSAAAQNLTLANTVNLGAAQTWNVAGTHTLAVSGAITGSSMPLTKAGAGTLTLSGAASTFNGGLTISAGTVAASSYQGLGAGTVTLGDANTGDSDVVLLHQVSSATSQATNIVVAPHGAGLSKLVWSQDWFGTAGKTYNTATDWTLTLNGSVNFQCTGGNKQIAPFVTGSGVAAGDVAIKIDGGPQVTWTAAMNAENTAVRVNDFTGNVWITGNTRLQAQNRSYQSNTPPFYNSLIPDSSTVIVDSGSTLHFQQGAETIAFVSGSGNIQVGTNTSGNALTLAGNSSTPAASGLTGTATFSGTFSVNQSALTKTGTGTQEFSGTGITYSTATNLNDGKLKLTKTTGWNSNIAFAATGTPELQLDLPLSTDTWTFTKQLAGGSANARIEKTGPGTLLLNPGVGSSFVGASSGALTVTGGKLLLGNGNITNPPSVSMAEGTTFGGNASVGSINVPHTATLEGGASGIGTLTAGDVVLGNAPADTVIVKGTLSTTPGYKPVAVNSLTINGGNQSVLLDAAGAGLVNGTAYDVVVSASAIIAPNASGVVNAFKSNSRSYTPVIDGSGNKVQLLYDQNASIYWVGTSGGNWNTSDTQNWKLSGNNVFTKYQAGDIVFFHDSPANPVVSIEDGNVTPAATVFDNTTTTEYKIGSGGDFGIATGSITKNNNGAVIFEGHNTTSGPVALNGGTAFIWYDDGLGSGPITFDGGKLAYDGTPATWARSITVNAGGGTIETLGGTLVLTHTGVLGGSGTLHKTGDGTLELAQVTGTVTTPLHIVDGTLKLNYGAGAVTYSGDITGSSGLLRLEGTGASPTTGVTLTWNNTFSGETHVHGRRIFLNSATLNGGIGGNIIIKSGGWPYHGLTIMANEQIADSAVLRFENTIDSYDFRLNGHVETLAGIESLPTGQVRYLPIIENAGYDGGNDGGIPAGTLIVSGGGAYNYYGQLRNQNGSTNGALSFTKAGTGTQTLSADNIIYTGATAVDGGNLILEETTNFASSGVTVNGGTLTVNNTTGTGTGTCPTVTVKTGATLAGAGSLGGTSTIEAGGTIAPGTSASAGTLTAATASLAGNYQCQLDGASGDRLDVTGTLTIVPGATITISELNAPTEPVYTILSYGTLAGEPLPTVVPPSGYSVDTTSTPGQVKLVSGNAYDTWASSNITNPNDRDELDDPDHDGLANILEFVTNGNPMSGTLSNLPTMTNNGANVIFTFTRRDDAASLNPTVEFNTDLGITWTTAVHGEGGVSIAVTPNGTEPDTVQVTIPRNGNAKLFARLKVPTP